MPTSNPRRGAMVGRGQGIAAVGGLQGRVRSLDELHEAAVASSRMDVESNLPLAPVSCGTTSELTS